MGDDYAIEIIEIHHDRKVDAPSGSALKIAEAVAKVLGRDFKKVGIYGRAGKEAGPRDSKEIGIHAIRGGNIPGEHTIMFIGKNEQLEIIHRVRDRSVFAQGAIRAAEWVVEQKPGLYSMQDILRV